MGIDYNLDLMKLRIWAFNRMTSETTLNRYSGDLRLIAKCSDDHCMVFAV
jgi:hypothetical protein